MSRTAIRLIQHCLDTKDPFLDLGNCGLTDNDVAEGTVIDKLLGQCTHLQTLILSSGWYEWDLRGNWIFTESLNKNNKNKFGTHPPAIEKLVGLSVLVCAGDYNEKWGISNLFFAAQLINLHHLNIGYNQIQEIKGLDKLIGLKKLVISSNQIQEIKGLDKLVALQQLNICSNQIQEIKGLDKLVALQQLDISSNQIQEIKGLDKLIALEQLYIRTNQIQEIKGLDKLIALQLLDVSYNQIQDISPLVPFLIKKKNPLEIILKDVWSATIGEINVMYNPLTTPPMAIVEHGNEAVLRYFGEELEVKYEAKILIVGEPEAGKTSLMKKLTDTSYTIPAKEDSTIGIQVIKWNSNHRQIPKPIQLNIWDFGGQEMQYLTHQFFLSSDALYILLTSARKDYDNLDYWFNIISLLGKNESNENSELLVVANEIKMKEGQVSKTFDERKYRDLYPHLPFTFLTANLASSADKDGRFATLQHLINEKLVQLPILGKQLPVKWGIARARLIDLKINYVGIQQYLEVCKTAGIEEKLALDLSSYLHKIGEAVHFKTDDYVILNPEWAVDGVYSILKRKDIEDNDGHFTQQQVYALWEKTGYTYPERNLLLRLMAKDSFEVAYKIPGKQGEYIAPQLLSLSQPNYHWDQAGALHFHYFYPFMPKGIVTRLIVRLHQFIKYENGKGLVWRTGVVLEKNGCIAKVEETKIMATARQVIAIEVLGNNANRKLLLYDICSTIEGIHKASFSKINFERLIPCNCDYCRILDQPGFFDYNELIQYIDDEIEKIRCKLKPKNEISIRSILEDIFDVDFTMMSETAIDYRTGKKDGAVFTDPFGVNTPGKRKKKIFISYSEKDTRFTLTNGVKIDFKSELETHLKSLNRLGLADNWSDTNLLSGEDWDNKLKAEIADADIILFLVSANLIGTDYVWDEEMPLANTTRKTKTLY